MDAYLTHFIEFLNLLFYRPSSVLQWAVQGFSGILIAAVFLAVLAGVFKLGGANYRGSVVFVAVGLLLSAALYSIVQTHFPFLFEKQDPAVRVGLTLFVSGLLIVSPLLKSTWPGGYFSAVIAWFVAIIGFALVELAVSSISDSITGGAERAGSGIERRQQTEALLDETSP